MKSVDGKRLPVDSGLINRVHSCHAPLDGWWHFTPNEAQAVRLGPTLLPSLPGYTSMRYNRAATSWNMSARSKAEWFLVMRLKALYITL